MVSGTTEMILQVRDEQALMNVQMVTHVHCYGLLLLVNGLEMDEVGLVVHDNLLIVGGVEIGGYAQYEVID